MKKISLAKTVFELTEEYPELIDILSEIGFSAIKNQAVRKSIGKFVTIPQACERQGKKLRELVSIFKEKGFEIEK